MTDLSAKVLRNIPPQAMDPVYILFGLVAFPLFAIAWYFALSFASGILDEDLSPLIRIVYIILWAVLFGIFLVRIQFALHQQSLPPSVQILNKGSLPVAGVIPIAIYVYFLVRAGRRTQSEEKAGLMKFGTVSLACYLLIVVATILPQEGRLFRWAASFLLGATLLSPVLVLKSILSRSYRPTPPGSFEGPKLIQTH